MKNMIIAVALVLVAVLTGCSAPVHSVTPSIGSPSAVSEAPVSTSGPIIANGHGWTDAGLDGPIPAPGTCHIRWTADHEPLPDPKCTPGAFDSAVTAATLKSTVCRKGGYSSSVRPPAELTNPVKLKLLAAYGIPASDASKYELDHLLPIGAAGGASDVRNLWPQLNVLNKAQKSEYVANDKDEVENQAFTALCSGRATLDDLRKQFASDWTQIKLG